MGILNVTPDSFSDGGEYQSFDAACARALEIEAQGADILDVGGESTRPGSPPVPPEEEQRRVIPVMECMAARLSIPISIDTWHASTAKLALDAGASIVNDVTAMRGDPGMASIVAAQGVPVVLMHALWPPSTMQTDPEYVDVVEDVCAFLEEQARVAMEAGVKPSDIIVDPGIGFGKTLEHNLDLLRGLPRIASLGFPVLVGPSRKAFLGALLDKPAADRVFGTAAATAICSSLGADIVRVHDVAAMKDVARVVDAIVWQV